MDHAFHLYFAHHLRRVGTLLAVGLAMLFSACTVVPLSSLWQLSQLKLEELDGTAVRAALVYPNALQLRPDSLRLHVAVARPITQADGKDGWERIEEHLLLDEVRSSAELRPLQDQQQPGRQLRAWRIAPASLLQLQALRARALNWKGSAGQRQLSLGLEFDGCLPPSTVLRVSTLLRFAAEGDYVPLLRDVDLARLVPSAELMKKFPACVVQK